ncbi:BOLL protein, partial [Callaeas wilsoni]|nr:BOLL protein [Callaeas wilsoni]
QATDRRQTESLPACPNTVSPARLNDLIHSPRFGAVIPNRVFVGGIDFKTNENELKIFFAQYGNVTDVNVINNRAGVPMGYTGTMYATTAVSPEAGAVTSQAGTMYATTAVSPEAGAVTSQAGTMYATTAVSPEAGAMYLTTSSGYPYVYHNGVAYFHASEVSPVQQPWPSHPVSSSSVMVAPPVHQFPMYHYQAPAQCPSSQCQWSVLQSSASSPPLLYLQPSEVFYQPIGINQEGGCISPPLLMETAVPELYPGHGVQMQHHQPYVQSHIAMTATV